MIIFVDDKQCEECFTTFRDAKFGEGVCVPCRKMKALERIADVLEHWVGLQ